MDRAPVARESVKTSDSCCSLHGGGADHSQLESFITEARQRGTDDRTAPQKSSKHSKITLPCRPPPVEIRLRKTVPRPRSFLPLQRGRSLDAKDGLGQVLEGLQMTFDSATRVAFGGTHADQERPVTGLGQQQFPARLPRPFPEATTRRITGFSGDNGRAGHRNHLCPG